MSLIHNANVVREGLVLHLDAANPKSYPGSGTTIADLSGNNNNGTLVNGVGYSSSNNGSLVFDGADDYIDTGSKFTTLTNNITYSFWVNTGTSQTTYADIFGMHQGNYKGVVFQQNGANLNQYYFSFGNGTKWAETYNTVTLDSLVWQYVVVIKSSIKVQIYKDSNMKVDIDNTDVISPSDFNFCIGNGYTSPRRWRGKISNFLIYNRALSAEEITQNFEATRSRFNI